MEINLTYTGAIFVIYSPLVSGPDSQIRIHTKMSRIRNTATTNQSKYHKKHPGFDAQSKTYMASFAASWSQSSVGSCMKASMAANITWG